MNNEREQYRYLFLVRQPFNEEPHVDSFYEVKSPAGISAEEAKTWTALNPDWCKKEIEKDKFALQGMTMRMRFNSDIFNGVCLVRTDSPISAEELDAHIKYKYNASELKEFLKEAKVG